MRTLSRGLDLELSSPLRTLQNLAAHAKRFYVSKKPIKRKQATITIHLPHVLKRRVDRLRKQQNLSLHDVTRISFTEYLAAHSNKANRDAIGIILKLANGLQKKPKQAKQKRV